MTAIKQLIDRASSGIVTALTTELNSLTTTGSALSSAVANSSDLDLYADLELLITYGSGAPTDKSAIEAYLVDSIDDGSNYEDASTTGPVVPRGGLVGSFRLRSVTSTQRIINVKRVLIPPGNHKWMLWARTTAATADSSGNTLRVRYYKRQVA